MSRLAIATVGGRNADAARLRAEFQIALSGGQTTRLTRNWPRVDVESLPSLPGVYVISDASSRQHYVGLALDLSHRFWNDTYGHLSTHNKSRSRTLVAREFSVYLPLVINEPDAVSGPNSRLELSRNEIETYVALTLSGGHVLNSLSLLGRVGQSPCSPVIVADCATGLYAFADSATAATKAMKATALFAVLHGYQRTARGLTARFATPNEAEQLADEVDATGLARGPHVMDVVAGEPPSVKWTGAVGRTSKFEWVSGGLSANDRKRLLRYQRHLYEKQSEQRPPRFNGVSWDSREQKWQCRAKSGSGTKDLWQRGQQRWSELEAAVVREEKIQAEGWQRFNTGKYASNASILNTELGEPRFSAW